MTERELALAAQQALACINDKDRLAETPLLERYRLRPFEQLQAVVYDAIAALASKDAPVSDKRRRHQEILVRCDLHHEAHKSVAAALGISRREFYRERREALFRFGDEIRRSIDRPNYVGTLWGSMDLTHAGHALLESSRWSGHYGAAWRQACALAPRYPGEGLEITLWIIAAEAASHWGRPKEAIDALAMARSARTRYKGEHPLCADLWIAAGEIDLRCAAADYRGARFEFERVEPARCDERVRFDDSFSLFEARLYRDVLTYMVCAELDRGDWERARGLLARASGLSARCGDANGGMAISGLSLTRLEGEVALRADGYEHRSIDLYEEALRNDRSFGYLGSAGMTAGYYATALDEAGSPEALDYAEYGLEVVRHYYPGDRLAKLTLELLPLLVREKGTPEAHAALSLLERRRLGARDAMLLDLAEAKMAFHNGEYAAALGQGDGVAERLGKCGMHAWECDALLVAAEASIQLGDRLRAAARLAELSDRSKCATAQVQSRSHHLLLKLGQKGVA
jgi:hypothetical protein